jgi:hypothetical protein
MPRKPWRKYRWNKTIQYWLRNNFAIEHEKSIQALVYVGAAFLVIVVGLRGLGDISNTSYVPKFLLNQDGKIDSSIVMIGLLIEFVMLCLLAAVSFFSPRDKDNNLQSSINDLAGSVETLAAGVPSQFAESIKKNAREVKSAVEDFMSKEMEVIESIKVQTKNQSTILNEEFSLIRENLLKGIKDSTNQITDFLQNEKEVLSNHFTLVDKLMSANRETIQTVTENLTSLAKNSSTETKGVFEREKEIINNFYNINSGLISKSGDEFHGALTNLNDKIEVLVTDAKVAFQNVTESLKDNLKSSSAVSNEVFEQEKEIIKNFHNINSGLISKSGDEFRGALTNLKDKIEVLVTDTKIVFQNVTESLKDNLKSSSAVSSEVFEREKEMIDKFYKVNSELIAKTSDEFRSVLKNYNHMLEQETERLKWLSANQLRPTEYMLKTNKTNERLVTHLENIDNTLKVIMNEISTSGIKVSSKKALYKKIKLRWQRLINQVTS